MKAARRLGKTIVAPTIPFAVAATGGYNANSWKAFAESDGPTAPNPGAIQVDSATFKGIVQGGVESLMYIGFKNIFLMGDHGGGQNEMRQVAEEMTTKFAAKGIKVPGGVALQAFIITGSVLAAMLALYSMRIVKPTPTFVSVVSTATGAIMITYLLSFVLSFFGVNLPFISMFSAANDTGMAAWIGLGINVVILGIASMWLIIDFGMIEQRLRGEAPKYIEWYCGFALLVTLAWIYYESVKLVLRVASLLNRR